MNSLLKWYSFWFCWNIQIIFALSRIKAVWSKFRLLDNLDFILIGLCLDRLMLMQKQSIRIDYQSHIGMTEYRSSELSVLILLNIFLFCYIHRWKLNDSFILPRQGSRYSLVGGNLHISHLNKEGDVGIYQCLASNSFGTIVSREASLHIACKYNI